MNASLIMRGESPINKAKLKRKKFAKTEESVGKFQSE
jgi:hypothetical protein